MFARTPARRLAASFLPLLFCVATLGANGCTVDQASSQASGVHGTNTTDTSADDRAVGIFNGRGISCTASIVALDGMGGVGLMAASCVSFLAQRCETEDDLLATSPTFRVMTGGVDTQSQWNDVYQVDRMVTHPDAYLDLGSCNTSAPLSCAASHPGLPSLLGIDLAHDLALFHFRIQDGPLHAPPSSFGIAPLHVVTSISDSVQPAAPRVGLHVAMDASQDFEAGQAGSVWPIFVGFGADDVVGNPATRRGSGGPFLYQGPTWDQECLRLPLPGYSIPSEYCYNGANSNLSCALGGNHPDGSGKVVENVISVHRAKLDLGGYYGPAPGFGDEGGPLLLRAGQVPELAGSVGSSSSFVLGVLSLIKGSSPDGVELGDNDVVSIYAPTFSYSNREWLEITIGRLLSDTDGDGRPNGSDNCPWVKNADQANCNAGFETALHQKTLGDACDPVPCPSPMASQALVADPTAPSCANLTSTCAPARSAKCPTGCVPNSGACGTCQCCGYNTNDVIATGTTGAFFELPALHDPTEIQVNVSDTHMRFCQSAGQLNCEAAYNDAQLDNDTALTTPMTVDVGHPWHQTKVVGRSGVSTLPAGTRNLDVQNLMYGLSYVSVQWLYSDDLSFWLSNPSQPAIVGCQPAQPGCLDGQWWENGATDVGQASNPLTGIHPPDTAADTLASGNIADGVVELQPRTSAVSWCPIPHPLPQPQCSNCLIIHPLVGPLGWGAGTLVVLPRAVSPQLDLGVRGDARFLVATTAGVVGALEDDGSAIAAENVGGADCGGAQIDGAMHDLMFAGTSTWLSSVEPSPAIPGLPVDAVALSNDGTQVVGTAQTVGGQLRGLPVGLVAGDPPVPRTDYVAAYSRAAGGIFIAGGRALSDNSNLHDVWFASPAGVWTEVTPHGSDAELGTVRALTYSYADRKLWIIDEPLGAGPRQQPARLRLLRASPGHGIEPLATWSKTGLVEDYFLSVDHDGKVLVSFAKAKGQGFVTLRVGYDPLTRGGRVEARLADTDDRLLGPAVVSPVGYRYLVQHGQTVEVVRVPSLLATDHAHGVDETL